MSATDTPRRGSDVHNLHIVLAFVKGSVTFKNMILAKHHVCIIRALPRYPEGPQRAELEAHGCGVTFDLAKRGARTDMLNTLRNGDLVKVHHALLLAEPKKLSTDNPRRDLWAIIAQIEERGAVVVEVSTGRTSANPRERDGMIADAIERLTKGSRAYDRKQAVEHGKLGGRPKKDVAKGEADARRLWFDPALGDREKLRRFLRPTGWSISRCYKEFGGRGERE